MIFRINEELWELCFVPADSDCLLNNYGEYTLGITVPEERRIYISDELEGARLHHVLCHELFHAEMVARNVFLPIYIEEVLCDIVADNAFETMDIAQNIHGNLCRYYGKC